MLLRQHLDPLAGRIIDRTPSVEGSSDLLGTQLLRPFDERGDGRPGRVALTDDGDRLLELQVDDLLGGGHGFPALIEPLSDSPPELIDVDQGHTRDAGGVGGDVARHRHVDDAQGPQPAPALEQIDCRLRRAPSWRCRWT